MSRMKLTKEERMRRLLVYFYDNVVELPGAVVNHLALLDALKDVIEDDEDGMEEWTISSKGRLRFK